MTMFGRLSVCLSVCLSSFVQPVTCCALFGEFFHLPAESEYAHGIRPGINLHCRELCLIGGLKTGNRKRRTGKRGNIICMGSKT